MVLDSWKTAYRQAALIMAPSITTPALTYFQSATSSFSTWLATSLSPVHAKAKAEPG
jgi:hypothetical protein